MGGEAHEVTVARLDDVSEADLAIPWRERRQATLSVRPDETLEAVLQRAARELKLHAFYGAFVGFHRGGDGDGFGAGPVHPTVVLVDDQGRVSWLHMWGDTTFADLMRSYEAGALDGDPRKLYLVDLPPMGDGVIPEWDAVVAVYHAIEWAVERIADVGGTAAALELARRKLLELVQRRNENTAATIGRKGADWASRQGDPNQMRLWLDDRSWFPSELSPLLDCTEQEAEAILSAYGFGPSPSGLWHKRADAEAEFMEEVSTLALTSTGATPEQVREIVQEELEEFVRTGEARLMEWDAVAGEEYVEDHYAGGRRSPISWARDLFRRE